MTNQKSPIQFWNLSYTLTKWEWNLCLGFARKTAFKSANLYFSRGAPSLNKIIEDIALGKAAEVAAYHILNKYFNNLSQPDFNPLHPKQKSYSPDLTTNQLHLHVKSTTNGDSPSWLFSLNDPITQSPTPPNSWAPLFSTPPPKPGLTPTPTLLWLVNLEAINEYKKWRLPISNKQKNKVALYHEDLINEPTP